MRKYLIAALPIFFIAGTANAQNALVNGGFESGTLDPWIAVDTPTLTTAEAHTGVYSVAAFASDGIRQDFSSLATSQITEVSFWVKRLGGPFDSGTFYYDDASTSDFLINGIGTGDDWKFFDVTSELTIGKNLTGFLIFGTTAGPAYFDDFTIGGARSAVPEPAAWAVMLLGFGFVGGAMRSAKRRHKVSVSYA
jgi:hypothetical protein